MTEQKTYLAVGIPEHTPALEVLSIISSHQDALKSMYGQELPSYAEGVIDGLILAKDLIRKHFSVVDLKRPRSAECQNNANGAKKWK